MNEQLIDEDNHITGVAFNAFAFALDPNNSSDFLKEKRAAIARQSRKKDEPDVLVVYHPQPEGKRGFSSTLIRTTFFPTPDAENTVRCVIGSEILTFDPGGIKSAWAPAIEERNEAAGFVLPLALLKTLVNTQIIAVGSNFQADRDLHRGLMLKDKDGIWGTNDNKGTKYYNVKDGAIEYQPPEMFPEWWYQTREATLQQLDKRFREMRSELTADVIDILFHHWYEHRNPKKADKAAISLSQLCAYRGKQLQTKNLRALWQAMRDTRSFRLTGNGVDAALFEMDSAPAPQLNLWNLEEPPKDDVVYFYSPGFFLSEAIKANPIYIAPYLRKIWELNPQKHSIAKKLARYLRGEWRGNTENYLRGGAKPTRWRTWEKILFDAGIDVDEYLDKNKTKDPGRLRKEVESALNTLYYELEYIGDIAYHTDDQQVLNNLPRKGAMQAWLQLRVCIDPATDITDALTEPDAKRRARSAAKLKALQEGQTEAKKARRKTKKSA